MSDVKVTVGIDDSELQKQLKSINSDLKQTNKLYNELGKGNNFAKQLDTAQEKAELLTKKMKLQEQQINNCENELKQYKNQIEGLDAGSDEFVKLTNKIEKTETKLKNLKSEFKLTEAQLDSTESNIKGLENKLESLGNEFDETKGDVKGFEGSLESVGAEAKEAEGKFASLRNTLKNINFASIGSSIQSAGYSMQAFGSNILSGFINGLEESKEFTAELETQEFLLKQLPKDVQDMVSKLGTLSIDFGFTEAQGKSVATELASFFERQGLTSEVNLTEVFSRAMDLSAMYDLDINEVVERIQKMLLGNFENSDALGFNMNVSSIEQLMNVDWKKLSYGEQQLVALEYIMKQTEATSGRAAQEAEGFASQWNLMKTNMSETKNSILACIQDAILPFIQKVNEVATPIKEWISENEELVAKIGLVAAIIAGLMAALGSLLIPIGTLVMMWPLLSSGFSMIGTAIGAICSPIGLVVAAIAALVAGLVYAYNHSEKFRNIVNTAWDTVKNAVKTAIDFVTPYIEKFVNWLPGAWETATSVLGEAWIGIVEGVIDACGKVRDFIVAFWEKHGESIKEILVRAWDNVVQTFETLRAGIETVFNALKAFWDKWGGTIMSFFSTVWNNMKTGFEIAWNAIKTVFDIVTTGIIGALKVFFQIIDGDFSGAWETIKTTTETVWGTLKTFITDAMSKIWEAISTGFTWIRDNAPVIWGAFVEFVKTKAGELRDFVVEKFNEIAPKVAEFLKELPGKIYDWLCEVLPKIIEWGASMATTIGEALKGLFDIAKDWFVSTIIPKFKEWIQGIIDRFVELKDKAIEKVKETIEKIKDWFDKLPYNIGVAVGKALKAIVDWGKDMVAKGKETGKNFLDKIVEFFKQLPTKVGTFITNTYNKVVTWVSQMITKAREAGQKFINGVVDFVKNLPTKIGTYLTTAISKVTTWVSQMVQKAKDAGTRFVNGVIDFVKTLPSKFKAKIDEVITKVTTFASNLKTKASQAGQSFTDTLINKLTSLPSKVFSIGQRIVQSIWNGISGMVGWLRSRVSGFIDGIVAGLTGGKDMLGFDVNLTSEYGTSLSGAPLSVFDYGKDVKTYSLDSFASPYLYGNTAESRAFTNAFSESATYNYANSQSTIYNKGRKENFDEVKEQEKGINIEINIENMRGTEADIKDLVKQIEQHIRVHSKKW
jgi:phage-related protein